MSNCIVSLQLISTENWSELCKLEGSHSEVNGLYRSENALSEAYLKGLGRFFVFVDGPFK